MKTTVTDHEIVEEVLGEFKKIAAIPRQSGQEEQVSAYLIHHAQSLGLRAVRDAARNVIIERAASAGRENAPVTILQAHMDMVCVAEEGREYDPLKDGITLVYDGDYLSAAGTSLGADDGMGLVVILYLLRADFPHGPLRAIFTVDEECGMSGAITLDPCHLAGRYLINCDSEDFDCLTVSSAGSVGIDFTRTPSWQPPAQKNAYTLTVKGLLGGHSGMEINCGRANAVRVLAYALDQMQSEGVPFELADLNGGMARNAIPSSAAGVIVIGNAALPEAEQAVARTNAYMKAVYGDVEKNYTVELTPTVMPDKVLSGEDCTRLIDLLCLVQIGVSSMSQSVKGLVETSANLGIVTTSPDALTARIFPRSARDASIDEIKRVNQRLANLCGFSTKFSAQSPGWPQNVESKLAPLLAEVFASQNGQAMHLDCIHAGLECSYFYQKNPALDIVSIGPTITGVHSPQEKVDLRTVAPHVRLIIETLTRLSAV